MSGVTEAINISASSDVKDDIKSMMHEEMQSLRNGNSDYYDASESMLHAGLDRVQFLWISESESML